MCLSAHHIISSFNQAIFINKSSQKMSYNAHLITTTQMVRNSMGGIVIHASLLSRWLSLCWGVGLESQLVAVKLQGESWQTGVTGSVQTGEESYIICETYKHAFRLGKDKVTGYPSFQPAGQCKAFMSRGHLKSMSRENCKLLKGRSQYFRLV